MDLIHFRPSPPAWGRDPAHHVVPLDHAAVGLSFAGLMSCPLLLGMYSSKQFWADKREEGPAREVPAWGQRGPPPPAGQGTGRVYWFPGSSTSMLRFSSVMIPLGSLS